MSLITIENIEHEIRELLEKRQMNCDTLERFVLLSEAKEHLAGGHIPAMFTEEDARKWVAHMEPPARWTMEQTSSVLKQHGWNHRACEFYAVMNSLVSDYGATMAKYGVDRTDLWAELAHDWLNDTDAKREKTAEYWKNIVKHE